MEDFNRTWTRRSSPLPVFRAGPVATENHIRAGAYAAIGYSRFGMIDLLKLLGGLVAGACRSHAAREAELAFLRQQLVALQRSAPARLGLRTADRLIFVWLYRLFPSLLEAAVVFRAETLVRWLIGSTRRSGSSASPPSAVSIQISLCQPFTN
jgi:hypothetical protein